MNNLQIVLWVQEIIILNFVFLSKGDFQMRYRLVNQSLEDGSPWTPFRQDEIVQAFKSLSYKKSCGVDELPMRLIKDCVPALYKPLTRVFNYYLGVGQFLDKWKLAKVTPIHKKGRKDLVEN